jgi:hypothetical protein
VVLCGLRYSWGNIFAPLQHSIIPQRPQGRDLQKELERIAPMPNEEKQRSSSLTDEETEPSKLPEQKTVDVEEVCKIAYRFWQERGCPTDSPEEDWFRAERELAADDGTLE